jgi:peptidoglycan/LPS O-acetylase OafA/YrhL
MTTRPVASARFSGQIPSLDGIRAISFLLVFAAHAGLDWLVPGGFGVTIFFFLSGYLITTLMRHEQESVGHINLQHFWMRRALRILPPFYIVLLFAITLALVLDPPGSVAADATLWQALHISNYWIILHGFATQAPGTNVYWSLAVEEHFYLLFPWLFIGMQRLRLAGRQQALILWTLCALILGWRLLLIVHRHAGDNRTYLGSDTRVDSILFGCALAVWRNPAMGATAIRGSLDKFLVLPLSLLTLLACLIYRDPVFRETLRYSLQGIALTGVFYCAVRRPDWGPFRLLNSRPMKFLGVLSYSLYLLHYVILQTLSRHAGSLGQVPRAVLGLIASVLLAWAINRLIEQPCARLRRRLVDVSFRPQTPGSSVA